MANGENHYARKKRCICHHDTRAINSRNLYSNGLDVLSPCPNRFLKQVGYTIFFSIRSTNRYCYTYRNGVRTRAQPRSVGLHSYCSNVSCDEPFFRGGSQNSWFRVLGDYPQNNSATRSASNFSRGYIYHRHWNRHVRCSGHHWIGEPSLPDKHICI